MRHIILIFTNSQDALHEKNMLFWIAVTKYKAMGTSRIKQVSHPCPTICGLKACAYASSSFPMWLADGDVLQVHLKIVQIIDCFLQSPIDPQIQLTIHGLRVCVFAAHLTSSREHCPRSPAERTRCAADERVRRRCV
jgi:hypothetical protein